jgi:Alcohol dehydrogenase GroES-like domain
LSRAFLPSREGVHTIESPAPSPEPHEVVVAVHAAQLARAQPHRPGAVPGVAAIGKVVAAGDQALSLLDQLVVVGSVDPCGQCEVCRRGGGTVCPLASHRGSDARGVLAERITVAGKWVVPMGGALGLIPTQAPIPDPTPDPEAASELKTAPVVEPVRPVSGRAPSDPAALAVLGGDAALAYTVYARSDLAPREPVVVLGASPVTRFLVEILLAKGLSPVVLRRRAVDAHGYERHDGGWRNWLDDKGVASAVVEGDAGSSPPLAELAELRDALEVALARREASAVTPPAEGAAAAPAALPEGPRGRPWKLIATEPHELLLATSLAGPRATVTAVVPRTTTLAEAGPRSSSGAASPDELLHSLIAAEPDAAEPASGLTGGLMRGMTVDPSAWLREVSIVSVTAPSPELILETAALVVRGQLDLDSGVAVVELSDLDPAQLAALAPTRSLVVRVPPRS